MSLLMVVFGGVLFLSSLVGIFVAYFYDRAGRDGKGGSFMLFSGGALLVGTFAGWVVTASPIARATCMLVGFPEETCGWVSWLFIGPIFFSLAVLVFVFIWMRRE